MTRSQVDKHFKGKFIFHICNDVYYYNCYYCYFYYYYDYVYYYNYYYMNNTTSITIATNRCGTIRLV